MNDINYNAFRILQNAKDRENGIEKFSYPSAEIKTVLRRMGLKRTPGTNGEGRMVEVTVNGRVYRVLAIER